LKNISPVKNSELLGKLYTLHEDRMLTCIQTSKDN